MLRFPVSLASVFLASSLGLSACGAPSLPVDDGLGSSGKSDSADTATLHFSQAGAPALTGALVAGRSAKLVYDLDRIAGCRSDKWAVTGYVLARGATEPLTVALSRLDGDEVIAVDGHFVIPNADALSIWFTVNDKYGCIAYDSNESANYTFAVTRRPEATIHFDADWSETVEGRIEKNGVVILDYELTRMSECPSSSAFAKYRIDSGSVRSAQLFPSGDGTRAAATVSLPQDANTLDLWFERASRYGCNETDSDYGANYRFAVK